MFVLQPSSLPGVTECCMLCRSIENKSKRPRDRVTDSHYPHTSFQPSHRSGPRCTLHYTADLPTPSTPSHGLYVVTTKHMVAIAWTLPKPSSPRPLAHPYSRPSLRETFLTCCCHRKWEGNAFLDSVGLREKRRSFLRLARRPIGGRCRRFGATRSHLGPIMTRPPLFPSL